MTRAHAILLLATSAVMACSSSYDSTAAVPTALVIRGGDGQSGVAGTRLATQVVVQVVDQNGQPASAVSVQFTATGALLGRPLVLSDAAGNAANVVTIGDAAGPVTVTASVSGIAAPAVFSLTATAGPAAALVAVTGNGQTGIIGARLDSALVVRVSDAKGNAVAGATVDWVAASGVLTTAAQTTSGADGTTSARLQLPTTPGSVAVRATLHGTTINATFNLTATAN